jgi:hypothetical protein
LSFKKQFAPFDFTSKAVGWHALAYPIKQQIPFGKDNQKGNSAAGDDPGLNRKAQSVDWAFPFLVSCS